MILSLPKDSPQSFATNKIEVEVMNTQIKSHWRLARRSTWKAITVTLQVAAAYLRAKYYIVKHSERLQREKVQNNRIFLQLIDEELDRVA